MLTTVFEGAGVGVITAVGTEVGLGVGGGDELNFNPTY